MSRTRNLLVPRHQIMTRQGGFSNRQVTKDGTSANDARDMALAKRIGETLERHYPGHPWMVEVNHDQGVVYLSIPIVMPRNRKWVIHIDRLHADPGLRTVVMAGGEIMERYDIQRSGFRLDHFLDVRAKQPMNRPRIIMPS